MYVISHLCMQVVIFMTKEKLEMSIHDHVDLSSILCTFMSPFYKEMWQGHKVVEEMYKQVLIHSQFNVWTRKDILPLTV